MCQKRDHFQAFLGASPTYLGERVAGSDEKEKWRRKKSSLQCHATLCEKTDSLRALDSVAIYLENGLF
jgi:hypothetical protein